MSFMNKTDFLTRIIPAAMQEMRESKILASLTIAQAILESGWAKSSLAYQYNNLFGVKASNADIKAGRAVNLPTQEYYPGRGMVTENHWFRRYESWLDSIRDHTKVLLTTRLYPLGPLRYKKVIGETDYKVACNEIQKAGYATDPQYSSKLIALIVTHQLYDIDREVLKVENPAAWKQAIVDNARQYGLISENHNPDEPAAKWFVLQVALNTLKKAIGGEKNAG